MQVTLTLRSNRERGALATLVLNVYRLWVVAELNLTTRIFRENVKGDEVITGQSW